MEKMFFGLAELQALGLPAPRTLRNNLDARSGLIRIGGDVPPLQAILIGGARVISKAALDAWLREVAKVSLRRDGDGGAATSAGAAATGSRRGRGRPCKSVAVGVAA